MKRLGFLLLPSMVMLGVIGIVFWTAPTNAGLPNSMLNADYSGQPPFISSVVTPNVLIMFDNSASMGFRAVCDNTQNPSPYNLAPIDSGVQNTGGCPTSTLLYPANAPAGAPFIETVTFAGLFDPLSCYSYDATAGNTRFVVTTSKATISTACASTDWDGNFLNWASFRRHDALIAALIGGMCVAARLADASCPPVGSPSLITIKGADYNLDSCCDLESTTPITPGSCTLSLPTTVSCANGRVPTAVQSLVTSGCATCKIVIHLAGMKDWNSGSSWKLAPGGFCVGKSNVAPPNYQSTTCGLTGAPTPPTTGEYLLHVAVATEPLGVIQDLGDKARFGLLEYRNSGDGGKVLVPIGWSVANSPYETTTVTTYNSNKSAMVAAIEKTASATSTPLAETLYTGIRYIAQLPQPYSSTAYYYPCAFSGCGPSFPSGSQTAGSIGPITAPSSASEPTQLDSTSPPDSCPSGLGYLSGACGRDPYFFGTNPAWSSKGNPKQVTCCKTFIMFLTDGQANADNNIPTALQDYAHAAHGPHCAGAWTGPPTDNPTAAQYLATTTCFESSHNSIAPAVLLTKHAVDYQNSDGTTYGTLASPSINHTVDDVAYWGHVNDLRQATVPVVNEAGHDLPGFQSVTVYPMFAFGNIHGRELLMQTAKQGGFNDQDGDTLGPGGVHTPNLQAEWDQVDNVTGLLVPDGIPDTYFESQHAYEIRDKLLSALTSLLQKAAAGTSISVLATSSTGEGAMYQAYFFPTTFVNLGSVTTQVAWTGFMQGLFIDRFGNIREDYSASGCTGAPDGKLVLIHDCIIRVRLETNPASPNYNSVVIDRYKDDGSASGSTAGDGLPDTTTPFQTVALSTGGVSNVQPMWEGGRRLALLSPGASCEGSNTWPQSGPMSQGGNTCRRILTWADINNDGGVGSGERLEFSAANAATLCPYLGGANVLNCTSSGAAGTTALTEATNIINWVRGSSVSGLRDRTFNVVNDSGAIVQAQWKLGDVMDASPVIVGAPSTRYDIIYGDQTYAQYFRRYKDRRQVAYVGANDGMLHAFNAGFFSNDDRAIDGSGPTVQVRFTTVPKQLGLSTTCAALPCDAGVATYSFRSDAPPLGAELWAFIPQDLLPQLRWLTLANYDHMYYVDLTPKVTDARIFPVTGDDDHPGGWGTILIGGFRLGGSCAACTNGKGTPRVVQADFSNNGSTTDTGDGASGQNSDYRVFLSSYFVLDVTNPEKEPTLLWVLRDMDLGLTTAAPAILRVKPSTDTDDKTSSTNEKWYVVFGTGPTHHDAFSTQNGQIYAVDLKLGPAFTDVNNSTLISHGKPGKRAVPCTTTLPCTNTDTGVASGALREYDTGQTNAFMGDAVTVDYNLDDRVDAIYAGSVICNGGTNNNGCQGSGPVWRGAMWRLTTNNGDTNPDNWGITSSGSQVPKALISTFAYTTSQATTCASASPCNVGPITAAPMLTQDDTHNLWLFFGTGRFFANNDKSNVDIQHFFGVKDCIISGGCTDQTVQRNSLNNSSNVVTCSSCASGTNVSTTGSTSSFTTGFGPGSGSLVNNIQNMDGWFTTFNDPTAPLQTPPRASMTSGERSLSSATLLGGTVFFTTFIPSTDICQATGTGQLYAVYYLTGGPYTSSAIGSVASGSNTLMSKSLSMGQGLPTQMQIHIGAELPSTTTGLPTTPGDCAGSRLMGTTGTGTSALYQTCLKVAKSYYSRMLTWRDL